MVIWAKTIENVLNRIYLEGISYNGKAPQLYWDAIQALKSLDKSCLTINSTSDPNCPLGWRRNNYPILVVGKKNNRLKFSYTKKQLNNGEILISVEEVADAYGNILTENKLKQSNIMKANYSRPLKDEFEDGDNDSWEYGVVPNDPSYQDMHNYFTNKSRYVKGKGWQ